MSAIAGEVARRRTFAIISHPDAGKTTLTEKLLLYGGAVQLAGSVTARKNQRATSWPAPISAKVPYLFWSRLICRAFWWVLTFSFFIRAEISGWASGG